MRNIILTLVVVLFQTALMAQAFEVNGKVTDEQQNPLAGVNVVVKGTTTGVITNLDGLFTINVPKLNSTLVFSFIGYVNQEIKVVDQQFINLSMQPDLAELSEVVVVGYGSSKAWPRLTKKAERTAGVAVMDCEYSSYVMPAPIQTPNTESYTGIDENKFQMATSQPLSTFSVDVDKASYSNIRRFINSGQMPPADAVRIEEMVNYFDYDYAQPSAQQPFSINSELSVCPWNTDHLLLHIGLQGKEIETNELPASNLVFLIDVSGSMSDYNKLPLLKSSFTLLVNQLRPSDRVAIVVYAGSSGLVLPSTSGNKKEDILNALNNLQAGGSTAGGAGLKLAYSVASQNFIPNGNNRIILATDGDFNVGPSSNTEMEQLIVNHRDKGIFMSVLGFGMGNYQDDKMELIADKGNGNYAYIDNLQEAQKVLVSEFGGTLFTIAKDVKFQLEFNPAKVHSYRLVGYENRMLETQDFENDKKDAGEIGAGHTVTALYEIIPTGAKGTELKYQKTVLSSEALNSNDLVTLKLRYKQPDANTSQLIEQTVKANPLDLTKTSNNFRFSAAVAQFGMLLRQSDFVGTANYKNTIELAKGATGNDPEGYRAEMIRLVKSAGQLSNQLVEWHE